MPTCRNHGTPQYQRDMRLVTAQVATDLQQMPTRSKLSLTGYRILTRISSIPRYKPVSGCLMHITCHHMPHRSIHRSLNKNPASKSLLRYFLYSSEVMYSYTRHISSVASSCSPVPLKKYRSCSLKPGAQTTKTPGRVKGCYELSGFG